MGCKGVKNAFLNVGEDFEFDKTKRNKKIASDELSNEDERDLAKAYTRFDNECPDQFDEFG
jgi:hypothetical protein